MKNEDNKKTINSSEVSIPPDKKKRSSLASFLVLVALLAVLGYVLFGIQLPYVFQAPGTIEQASALVRVNETSNTESEGNFYVTTVIYEKANIFLYLWTLVDGNAKLTPLDIMDVLIDQERQNEIMKIQMETSKLNAKVAAFRAMGYEINLKKTPVVIEAISAESKAIGILEKKDIIVSMDGIPIHSEEQVISRSSSFKDEETVTMVIKRNDKEMEVVVPLTEMKEGKKIGIMITSKITEANLPMDVNIESQNIIGSSAGLMFTLEIIRQASGMKLPEDCNIAGTGAIDDSGNVYPVSSVDLKVIAAEQENINYFFVPEDNYKEATSKATYIKIYPVRNLEDALTALETINPSLSIEKISADLPEL
jgi:Lon-like protease